MFTHKHAKRTRRSVELGNGKKRIIYVIETDLALTPDHPAYDEAALTEFVEAAAGYLAIHGVIYDSVRIDSILEQ